MKNNLEDVPSVSQLLGMLDTMDNAPILQHLLRTAAEEVILAAFKREEDIMRSMARGENDHAAWRDQPASP